ncbi:hypothetical protein FACS1894171_0840 [Clostridia bacterium]|nr:hypothetical protein FACS1894171_0840 [Clostridia bacterium]
MLRYDDPDSNPNSNPNNDPSAKDKPNNGRLKSDPDWYYSTSGQILIHPGDARGIDGSSTGNWASSAGCQTNYAGAGDDYKDYKDFVRAVGEGASGLYVVDRSLMKTGRSDLKALYSDEALNALIYGK